jgi:hypothetical protein
MLKNLITTSFETYAFVQSGVEITGFLSSENTIEQYRSGPDGSDAIPKGYGFSVIDTGGGCTAWCQKFMLNGRVVNMLLTDDGGVTHKIEPTDRMIVGVYKGDDFGQKELMVWEQDNFPLSAESNLPTILVDARADWP